MRHFLKFLPIDKRAEAERRYEKEPTAPAKPPVRPKISLPSRAKASVPPRVKVSIPAPAPRAAAKRRPDRPDRPDRRERQPSSAPEFGGLIERRKEPRDGARRLPSQPGAGKPSVRTPASAKSWDTRFDIDANDIKTKLEARAGESTGKFLASLDNSAITLADSGLFKADPPEEDPSESSFDPYDRN